MFCSVAVCFLFLCTAWFISNGFTPWHQHHRTRPCPQAPGSTSQAFRLGSDLQCKPRRHEIGSGLLSKPWSCKVMCVLAWACWVLWLQSFLHIFTTPKFKADGESSGDVAIYLWVMISASSRDQPSWTLRGWRSCWPTAEGITQTELNLREKIGMSELTCLKLPNCQFLVHVSRKCVKPYKACFGLLFFPCFFPSRRARVCLQLRFASAKMCRRYSMVYHIDPHGSWWKCCNRGYCIGLGCMLLKCESLEVSVWPRIGNEFDVGDCQERVTWGTWCTNSTVEARTSSQRASLLQSTS